MSTRHAMLALLSEGPRYGLRLREEFEARTGEVWPLNVGQVYTTLQRLERDGLVGADGSGGGGPQKHAKPTGPLALAWACDADLFRLDRVVGWRDVADARLERAGADPAPEPEHV